MSKDPENVCPILNLYSLGKAKSFGLIRSVFFLYSAKKHNSTTKVRILPLLKRKGSHDEDKMPAVDLNWATGGVVKTTLVFNCQIPIMYVSSATNGTCFYIYHQYLPQVG